MVLIIDCGSKKTPAISEYVNLFYPEQKVVSIEEAAKGGFTGIKGIIISGAPILLSQQDKKPFLEQFSFLKETEIPVLGICFGHQMIGLLHGAEVYMGKAVREPVNIEILKPSPLFKDLPASPIFCQDHTEGITLPDGFELLAQSADYKIEAMKHPEKPHWGVQFHPEVSGENGRVFFRNFLEVVETHP
jgi:GMP synthase (glutamine-hydrolysing)